MRISDWSSDVCSSDLPDGVKVCFPFTTEIGMTQGFARCLCLLLGCLLAACTTRTDAQEKDMGLDPATAAYQKYGYNDRPVEAHLGPHRYLIPANYFRHQITRKSTRLHHSK